MEISDRRSNYGLEHAGLTELGNIFWNMAPPVLYEHAIRNGEGHLAYQGPLVVRLGQHTGRAAKDKVVVDEPENAEKVWWGKINKKYEPARFDALHQNMCDYLRAKPVYVQDCYAGADERYRIKVRIITESAWPSLFASNMFINQPDDPQSYKSFVPDFTMLQVPSFHADPDVDCSRSGTLIALHLAKRLVLVAGSGYGGEIKKSIFTVMNYVLPNRDILSMHCSANVSKDDPSNVAIFFGLSGTGKTTLSADPKRALIGDDEHGWSDKGVFNFEGGCYAKVINLSQDSEPEIYACTRKFGTILENVPFDPVTREVDLSDARFTENTRASYPLTSLPDIVPSGTAGHPRNVVMLTADAFGVLPPIAKLTPAQAMYHFISGYTAKVAGTEAGINEPTATFSACFGAPFMVHHPSVYAKMLAERLEKHGADCWLVNTGWSGGPYGVGSRMSIKITRALLNAALDGSLAKVEMVADPNFGILVPQKVPGVPSSVLNPRQTWQDKSAYDKQAIKLAAMFRKNFDEYADGTPAEVVAAGPTAGS